MKFGIDELLCKNCYNNPPMFKDAEQYWWERGAKYGMMIALCQEGNGDDFLCWDCFKKRANQRGDELRNRIYREWRRDMLEEKDNLYRAARMTKEMRNRIKAEA